MSGAHIRYWWKNLAAITNSPALQGGGRHTRLGEVQAVLFDQTVFLISTTEKGIASVDSSIYTQAV